MKRVLFSAVLLVGVSGIRADGPEKPSPEEAKILELTNKERKQRDLAPLTLSSALSKIARAHSENMARQEKMDHKLDGKDPFDRLRDAGYKFMYAGENVAFGAGPPEIMKAWMDSKPHRENILLPKYSEIGIGVARTKKGELYYTQVFAMPRK